MTDSEINRVIHELGKVEGELKGIHDSLSRGEAKMNTLIEVSSKSAERISLIENNCQQRHNGCDDLHRTMSQMAFRCAGREKIDKESEKKDKIILSFSNLMKLLAFIAVCATCGMVAANQLG